MNRPRTASTRPDPAVSLGPWYRGVQSALRRAYFGRVRVAGTQPGPRRRSRLIVASHRNGALDGAIVLAAFPHAQHLVSLQLLRGPLRVLFTGIPVIRAKDVERYGMDRSQITDPVTAGVTHLRDGGDLVVFPEGTSEWRHAPGTHQRGAAKIWCRLQEEGIDVDVIPVGLFYAAPERYGSTVQPWVGPVLELPRSTAGRRIEREKEAHRLITGALDAVSVDCPSPAVFDGVQRQRIGIARSLALNPKFVVCDEAVSALDVSIQSQILNLLSDLKKKAGLTYLFITHDLSVVKYISDRIAVMYLGNLVELADAEELFSDTLHPYTEALLSAIPTTEENNGGRERILLEGDIPSPVNPPSGCKFHTRCRYCQQKCKEEVPQWTNVGNDHYVACHSPLHKKEG